MAKFFNQLLVNIQNSLEETIIHKFHLYARTDLIFENLTFGQPI